MASSSEVVRTPDRQPTSSKGLYTPGYRPSYEEDPIEPAEEAPWKPPADFLHAEKAAFDAGSHVGYEFNSTSDPIVWECVMPGGTVLREDSERRLPDKLKFVMVYEFYPELAPKFMVPDLDAYPMRISQTSGWEWSGERTVFETMEHMRLNIEGRYRPLPKDFGMNDRPQTPAVVQPPPVVEPPRRRPPRRAPRRTSVPRVPEVRQPNRSHRSGRKT